MNISVVASFSSFENGFFKCRDAQRPFKSYAGTAHNHSYMSVSLPNTFQIPFILKNGKHRLVRLFESANKNTSGTALYDVKVSISKVAMTPETFETDALVKYTH